MNNLGTKTIETERLILRKFEADDAECMYYNWANDDDVTRYITWPAHSSMEVSKNFISNVVKDYESDSKYEWCIELKENGEAIGDISAPRLFENVETVEIGYVLGKKYWNKGIVTEALGAVIKFFFEEVEVNRIEAKHDTNNPASGEVMKKCGMQFEGILRKAGKNNTGICDLALYSILKDDIKKMR